MKNRIFYKTECGKLIVYFNEHDVYVHKNSVAKTDKRIPKEVFDTFKTTKISKQEYFRLMNIYFKDIKVQWTYEGHDYMSLDNFETDGVCYSANYKIGKDIPFHDINKQGDNYYYLKNLILVYHQGKIYFHTISYGGYEQGQLVDVKTFKFVKWCKLKHCAPIFDKTTKKIV